MLHPVIEERRDGIDEGQGASRVRKDRNGIGRRRGRQTVLVVDGPESFALTTKGAKWVVTAQARSQPSEQSVREIFSDAAAHTILVVNPDDEVSAPASLP